MTRRAAAAVITGASGFIGGAMCRELEKRGFSVTGVTRRPVMEAEFPVRVIDYSIDSVARLVSELRPSVLFHAVGTASVAGSIADPERDFASSVLMFQHVLEGVRRSGVPCRVVFPSSAAVYGNPETLPVAESAARRPISPYGHNKAICEILASAYGTCFGVPSLVLRIFSMFGPAQRNLLVWDLFRKFRDDPEVFLDGTGEEARDFIHVEDFAAQAMLAIERTTATHAVLNVGAGLSVTVLQVAQRIGALLGSSKPVRFTGRQRPGDPLAWRADLSAFEALGGAPVVLDFEARIGEVLLQWRG